MKHITSVIIMGLALTACGERMDSQDAASTISKTTSAKAGKYGPDALTMLQCDQLTRRKTGKPPLLLPLAMKQAADKSTDPVKMAQCRAQLELAKKYDQSRLATPPER